METKWDGKDLLVMEEPVNLDVSIVRIYGHILAYLCISFHCQQNLAYIDMKRIQGNLNSLNTSSNHSRFCIHQCL